MSRSLFLMPPVALSGSLPDRFTRPKFSIGQQVIWASTSTCDRGRIVGIVYAAEASVQAVGYHYAIQLDPNSPSKQLGIEADWGFEADLFLTPTPENFASLSTPT